MNDIDWKLRYVELFREAIDMPTTEALDLSLLDDFAHDKVMERVRELQADAKRWRWCTRAVR